MDAKQAARLDLAWAVVRVVAGLSLAGFHGWSKIFGGKMADFTRSVAAMRFPMPAFFAWAASLSELVGGLLVAIGLFTRPAAGFAAFTMMVAVWRHRVDPFAKSELAVVYFAIMVAACIAGSGAFGIDSRFRKA